MRRLALLLAVFAGAGCGGSSRDAGAPGADLASLPVVRIQVDQQDFEVWLARTPEEQARGLMGAAPEQLAPAPDGTPRGMLFVFPGDRFVSFTMRDTWMPLDLAHFAADGLLLEVLSLRALDTTPVPSSRPVRYSLEVRGGELAARGIGPDSLLVPPPP